MRTMTSNEMMQANGGKMRYECVKCGARYRTWIDAVGHFISAGYKHNHFKRL